MAFSGPAYRLPLNGSWNCNENYEELPVGDLAFESRNADIHNGGPEKRGGTQTVGSQIASSLSSLGGGMLIKRNAGSRHTYWAGSDGVLYRNGSSIQTGRSVSAYTHFTVIDDKMFIANGVDAVKVDTGSAIATIATPHADWTGTTQPKCIGLHTKGGSRRALAWGVPGKENYLYMSVTGSFEDFNGAGSVRVPMDIQDGYGVVNCVSKDGTLWIQGKSDTHILDDSSTTTSDWAVYRASFKGGVHSPRHCTVIDNHIFAMNTEGDIYEVQTAEQVRDYKEASIIEPFFIHNYIRDQVNLSRIDQFHLCYDPRIKALRVFIVRTGQTTVDTCLVYLVKQSKWSPPHDSQDNSSNSGFSASASYLAETSAGAKKCYTQDYNGYTWELSSTTKTDNGNGYKFDVYTGWTTLERPGMEKRFPYGFLHYKSRGGYQINLRWWVDNNEQATEAVVLDASGGTLGSFVLDTDVLGTIGIDKKEFQLGQIGEKIRFSLNNSGAGNDFVISHLIIPFKELGLRHV